MEGESCTKLIIEFHPLNGPQFSSTSKLECPNNSTRIKLGCCGDDSPIANDDGRLFKLKISLISSSRS